ncbi:MAG TPA: septal ring lytic transglycosylase RlpA family protein [Stellaceae bacterium]|nr:septal ring lytic transglycosylase RlpA family protein [Stellaceae bacterium]
MPRLALVLVLGGLLALAACGTPRAPRIAAPPAAPGHGLYKVGNPYQIAGVWYYPAEDLAYDETGIASWYGEDFHGKYTANGEVFDLNALTAAHRTLPMPSIVQVTNLENGRSLKVRVNDRGPYARSRIIDLSRRSAQLLGIEGPGSAKVRVRIVAAESIQAKLIAQRGAGQELIADSTALPVPGVTAEALPAPSGVMIARADPPQATVQPAPPPAAPHIVTQAAAAPPALPEQVVTVPVPASAIYIQAGAFSRADNALRLQAKLAKFGDVRVVGARVNGADLFRVRIGPLRSVDEADHLLDRVVDSGVPEARIVVD